MTNDPNEPKLSPPSDSAEKEGQLDEIARQEPATSDASAPPTPAPRATQKTPRSGDRNVVNIGEGAKVDQIAVGRNILQAKVHIGSLVIPVRFLLVLLGVAAIAAVVVWWIATPGQMPPNTKSANIAVVEFAEEDEAGNPINTGEGNKLSQWLYTRLNDDLGSSAQEAAPVAWHVATSLDPIHLFQKRYTAGPVRNNEDAKRVAEQVGATIVVYGTLTSGDKTATFVPQFFVLDDPDSQETPELAGSQQMGKPIALPRPVSVGAFESSVKPLGRIVYWLTRGLTFDLSGNFNDAYGELLKGEPEIRQFDDDQGKEVFYYFLGTEALFLAQCEQDALKKFDATPDRSAVEHALDAAEAAYNEAIGFQHNYARAYFGLGQVASLRGQRLTAAPDAKTFGQCRVADLASGAQPPPGKCPELPPITDDPARLEQARAELRKSLDYHAQAIALMQGSTDTLLLQRIRTIRAITKSPLAQAYLLSSNVAEAEPLIQESIDELNLLAGTADAEQDPRVTALLNSGLGIAYYLQAYTRQSHQDNEGFKARAADAVASLQTCINIANTRISDKYLSQQLLPNCLCLQTDIQKMLSQ